MKASRLHQFGEPDVLVYEDAPLPQPQAGQVLVRVHAAGINPVDYKTRAGKGMPVGDNPFPLILGWDIAGTVEQSFEGSPFPVGTNVFGMVEFPKVGSAYADYVAAQVHELAVVPSNVDLVDAAAVPLVGLTAWQALFDTVDLQPGQRILIHAAAGGVGHIAVQLAKWRGAYVIGTASQPKHAFLREIGADKCLDYTTQRFEDLPEKVDVVLNAADPDTANRSFGVIKSGGKLVSVAGKPDAALAAQHNVQASNILVKPSGTEMAQLADLMAQGHLKTHVERVFPLSQAAEAHRLLETRRVTGKVVLKTDT